MSGIKNGRLNSGDWIIFQDLAVDLPMEPACFSGKNVYQGFEK